MAGMLGEEVMQAVLHVVRCISSCDHLEIDSLLWDPLTLSKECLRFCSETTLNFFMNHPFPCVHPLNCGTDRPSLEPPDSGQLSYYNLAPDLTTPTTKDLGRQSGIQISVLPFTWCVA